MAKNSVIQFSGFHPLPCRGRSKKGADNCQQVIPQRRYYMKILGLNEILPYLLINIFILFFPFRYVNEQRVYLPCQGCLVFFNLEGILMQRRQSCFNFTAFGHEVICSLNGRIFLCRLGCIYVSVMSLGNGQKCGNLSWYRERNAKDESVFVKGKRSSWSEGEGSFCLRCCPYQHMQRIGRFSVVAQRVVTALLSRFYSSHSSFSSQPLLSDA